MSSSNWLFYKSFANKTNVSWKLIYSTFQYSKSPSICLRVLQNFIDLFARKKNRFENKYSNELGFMTWKISHHIVWTVLFFLWVRVCLFIEWIAEIDCDTSSLFRSPWSWTKTNIAECCFEKILLEVHHQQESIMHAIMRRVFVFHDKLQHSLCACINTAWCLVSIFPLGSPTNHHQSKNNVNTIPKKNTQNAWNRYINICKFN